MVGAEGSFLQPEMSVTDLSVRRRRYPDAHQWPAATPYATGIVLTHQDDAAGMTGGQHRREDGLHLARVADCHEKAQSGGRAGGPRHFRAVSAALELPPALVPRRGFEKLAEGA